jgi:hypothetical protein
MLSFNLAELFVQFSAKGAEALVKTFDQIEGHLKSIRAGADAMSSAIQSTFGRAQIALVGFVGAGIASSAMGELLANRMGMLTREIAALFLPQIRLVIEGIQKLTDWFRTLSGDQQQNIARWIFAGAAMLAVAKLMPVLIQGLVGTVAGVRALTVAILGLESSTGIGALLPLVGALITLLASLAVGTEIGRHGFGRLWGALQPMLVQSAALFKSLQAAFVPVLDAMSQAFQMVKPQLLEMGKALGEFLVPAFKILADVMIVVIYAGAGLLNFFAQLTTYILKVVTPALAGLAAILDKIAKGYAYLIGAKTPDLVLPPPAQAAPNAPGSPHMTLFPRSSGFESLQAAWERIAKATIGLGGGKTDAQKQLEELMKSNQLLLDINQKIGKLQPAVI